MKTLTELTPYVGDSMTYLYDGSSSERLRSCNVYAFHLFTEGPGEMEVDGRRYPIDKRTLVFLRPGQPHAFHISPRQPLSSYNLYCDLWERNSPLSVSRLFAFAPETFRPDELAAALPCEELDALPSVCSLQPYPSLYELFAAIAGTFGESRRYRQEAANSLLYAWLLNWHDAVHARQPADYRIVRLLAHLNDHPERGGSIEAWSEFCGLKRTYFHELFLRETGLTPKAYHHKLIMKRAAGLLVESDLSVTAIAEKLGYPSIHPFTRHFGAFYGVSPKQYRSNPRPMG